MTPNRQRTLLARLASSRRGHVPTLDPQQVNCPVLAGVVFDSRLRVWDDRFVAVDTPNKEPGEHLRPELPADHPLNDGRTGNPH